MKQQNEYRNNTTQAGAAPRMGFVMQMAATLAVVAMGMTGGARAQAPTVVPIPFGSAIAGLAIGSTSTLCSVDIPTYSAVVHTGDSCLPTQASLLTPYNTAVDSLGNIYIGDYGHYELRVIYNGGAAVAAAIIAANTTAVTPQAGHIYAIAGGRTGAISKSGSPSAYYCNGGGSGTAALNSAGDGCPGTNEYIKPRTPVLDADGNIFFTSASGGLVRVFIVNPGTASAPTAVTKLLWANTNLVSPALPVVGAVYTLLTTTSIYSGDNGIAKSAGMYSVRDIAVDANENLYISDGNTGGTGTNNNIRKINGTTAIITTLAGSPGCAQGSAGCTAGTLGGSDGDGGLATAASFNSPYALFTDQSGNVYVADYANARIRVIYQTAGSTIVNVTNPQVGYIYTVAGGGPSTATIANNGLLATQLAFGSVQVAGMNQAGDIYLYDATNRLIWKVDGKTGYVVVVTGFSGTAPVAGAYCSGSTGPKSVDTGGDGCPGTQLTVSGSGQLTFDPWGNFYETESGNAVVREFSLNRQFPATAVGASVPPVQPLAFEAVTATNFTGESFSLQSSAATTEFSDPGGDTCTLNTAITAGKTCVFYAQFSPAAAGLRKGSITLAGPPVSLLLSGVGQAATASIDPGTQTTIGTGLKPNGVATDLLGHLYISDATSNTVKTVTASGGTPTTLISGLSNPAQIAVDGKGNIYVADTGNNRIAMTSAAGGTVTALGSGLSAPTGVAVDGLGDVFIADTGNNRVVELFANGGQKTLGITGLNAPAGLALDSAGDVFVADKGNSRVVEYGVSSGQTTVNLGTTTFIPGAVAIDTAGDLYVVDATNLQVLSYLNPSTGLSSNGTTVAVTGLTTPVGIAMDVNGSIYIADQGVAGAIAVNRTLASINFPVTNLSSVSQAALTFTSSGNLPLSFNGTQFATATGNTSVFSLAAASANGCALGTANAIASGNSCLLTASFSPIVKGNYSETIAPITNAANNGSLSGVLSGEAVLLIVSTTTTSITPTTTSIYYGQAVTVTATTNFASNGGTPVGTVQFTVDGSAQPIAPFPASGISSITLTNLAVKPHTVSVSVVFTGYVYASSGSSLNFTVVPAVTTTKLAVAPVTTSGRVFTTFTATVASTTGTGETGTVNFYSGGTLLNSTPMAVTGGVASYTTSTTTSGYLQWYFPSNSFTAVYTGDTNFNGSTSAVVQPAGDFNLSADATTVSIPQGGNVQLPADGSGILVTPYFGYSGTLTVTCSGLPQYSYCHYQPMGQLISGTTGVPFYVAVYTDTTLTSQNRSKAQSMRLTWALLSPLGLAGLLFARRKRLLERGVLVILAMVLSLTGVIALTGCTNPVAAPPVVLTPVSSQTVTVTFADSNTPQVSHSISFLFSVIHQ
jgi:sugar lactone lactonase YvrE